MSADVSDGLNATAQQVLNASESLDDYLEALSLRQRARIQWLERANLISAIILAPLALAAALVRGLTHDLKNPLGAAYGYAELLEDEMVGPVLPEQREMLSRIKGLVTLSVTTINDLLERYRNDAGGLQLQRVPASLEKVTALVVADFQAKAVQAGLTPRCEAPSQIEVPREWQRARCCRLAECVREDRPIAGSADSRQLGGDLTVTDWFEGGSVFTLWLPAEKTESAPRSPIRVA